MSTNTQIGKAFLVGRDNEINILFDDLNNNNKSIRLLVGESGIGKSKLLDEVYRRLRYEHQDRFFVGYYDKSKALISESQSLIYPFSIVLESLIEGAKESQQPGERIDNTLNRLQKTLVKFAKEEGMKMVEAIIEDVAKKTGLEQTLKVARGFLKTWRAEKTSLMLAEDYLAQHKEDALQSYLGIFRSLAEEFEERSFVLIFDQFESAGKSSIDFFLNFVKLMQSGRFHIIVAFRTETGRWEYDTPARKLFEETKDKLIHDLGGKELRLEGLSAESIGNWIKTARGVSPPLVPDLQRIRENSGGLPLLLDEWIKQSKDLKDYEQIKRDQLCDQIITEEKGLTNEDLVKLYKLAILLQPLKDERLAGYLEMENIDLLRPFTKELTERGIFEKNSKWFRHELVRKCFEDDLDKEEKRRYHNRAADFYLSLRKQEEERRNSTSNSKSINVEEIDKDKESSFYEISIGCAYHLHNAAGRRYEESHIENEKLARYACDIGDLDLAERCFKRAIDDSEHIGHIDDKMRFIHDMSLDVYFVWGRYDEAYKNCQDVLKYYQEVGDRQNQSTILNNMASILKNRGEYDQALKLHNESLEIKRQLGDQQGIGQSLNNMASILTNRGEYDQALKLYNESLEIARQLGDQYGIALNLGGIGTLLIKRERYIEALTYTLQAYKILERLHSPDAKYFGDNLNIIRNTLGDKEYQERLEKIDKTSEL